MSHAPVPISPREVIIRVRGQSVILDADLAKLYGVPTGRFNEQVKRNRDRFPDDFMFQLTDKEWKTLRSQSAISNGRGGRRYAPYVFTEHGAVMAANVLNSPDAIRMSVAVVRAFIQLRRMALSVEGFARKLNELESHYDEQFQVVFEAIRQLMTPPEKPKGRIGFHP